MASATKLVKMEGSAIEADVKAFLDEILIPMLVRDAMKDIAAKNLLASEKSSVAHSPSTALHSAEEMV